MDNNTLKAANGEGLLANRYRLKQLIGSGGMGQVFLAQDVLLGGVPVAIKFLAQPLLDARMQQDFAREARTCAALSQKSLHIVRVTDYGVNKEGNPFYVMEYLQGKSLKDLIPLSLSAFLTLTRQICVALQVAHQGIKIDGKVYPLVHRDIKPANVLVIPDPILGQLAKIVDFGIVKFLNPQGTHSTIHNFTGTLPYSSPEQMAGSELDNRSDIYSLGVMMFEMLTGQKPWQPASDAFGAWYQVHHFEPPKTIRAVSPHIRLPKGLEELILVCMAKSPQSRPQNLTEILKALVSIEQTKVANSSEQSTVVTKPVAQPPKTQPPNQSQPALTVGSGLNLAVEQACWKQLWPQNKPIGEIVFPQMIPTELGKMAALCLMMPKPEIAKRAHSIRYNEFVFLPSPHPMLLWLTVLFSHKDGAKWLPCYLDMQIAYNRQIVSSLASFERYPILCFSVEPPHGCTNVISSRIGATQRQMLKQWVDWSQKLPPSSQQQLSKNLLKDQYKQMQPRILKHLESMPESPAPDWTKPRTTVPPNTFLWETRIK